MMFSHYLGHIPKSGTSFAFGAISKLVHDLLEYKHLNKSEKFRPCDEGHTYHGQWRNFQREYRGVKCTMWMTEPGRYNAEAQHRYVIVREPISRTLSMYFHCKESKDHTNRARHMPSLDVWIKAWHASHLGRIGPPKNKKRFQCYNPMDFQSKAIHFNPELGKDDLRKKWDVIGDNAKMDKTICLIVIKYTGLVPSECNCSGISQQEQHQRPQRRLNGLVYNPDKHAHGVTHHGSTYNITKEQRQMISDFRGKDLQLYDLLVKEIFEEQVIEAEQKHNFTLCRKMKLSPLEAN